MSSNPFKEWLTEVSTDCILLNPDDINAEAHGNLWSFTLSSEQVAAVSKTDVVDFIQTVAASRGEWLTTHASGPMLFYCWHDEQAGQLRFSLVSAKHGHLPFGCEVVAADQLGTIVQSFLGSSYLGGIPWSELRLQSDDGTASKSSSNVLPVWSTRLP